MSTRRLRIRNVNGLTAADVEIRLAKKFAAPEYAFLPQLNQGTGSHAGRRADAVAMSVWPSRGLHLNGFEIKVARGDFLNELKQPAKAEAIQRYCHFWWLVTDKDVVRDGDLIPHNWGWMEVFGVGLTVKKQAPLLTPEEWSVPFVASLLRGANEAIPQLQGEFVPAGDVEKILADRVAEEVLRRDPGAKALRELQDRVTAFEAASGLQISRGWNGPEKIGAAVKLLLDRDLMQRLRERIKWQRDALATAVRGLDGLIAEDDAAWGEFANLPRELSA